jgi:hypothetical protein
MTYTAATATDTKKPVTIEHADYKAMTPKWQRCRDVAAGRDKVMENGLLYVPMLHEQSPTAYQDYLKRATFYGATWRTIAALAGMLFRKPEITELPDSLDAMLTNVNLRGEPLHLFAQQTALECLTIGRVGLLVDYPPVDSTKTGILTLARAQSMGLRPSIQRYKAESIINWRTGPVGNVDTLLLVVLTEEVETMGGTEFAANCELRYRVLDLVGDPNDAEQMAYRVRLFRIDKKTDSQVQIGPDQYPSLNGKPLRNIPFTFLSADAGLAATVTEPPLIDLVDLNLAHYRVSADYEHGCHFTGLPTPYIAGYQTAGPQEKLYVGSTAAWVFPDPQTRVGYLEFSGAGLGMLQANMERKEQQMASLGARLLMSDGAERNITATTAAIQHGGEASILAAVAQALSLGLSRALVTFAQWAGLTVTEANIKYEINRDFFPVPMDPATLAALVGAWQSGAISAEVLFANLQKGEVIDAKATFEDEQAKIANAPPSSTTIAPQQVA